ncbi:hypothetical protein [Rhodonellum sp.]|uniref:hypothetical protein n=1 Tax=Rhodonellum sp. TaxID=2231180 RepID=UPI002722FD80|nr:hypothetical protein [Rhodonellum sp.]MDO9553306.1 hypothetical protein [Rhodonellum sp.]
MLNNFFRINLPYGIAPNENGEWMAFNREYMPLGYNSMVYKKQPGKSYQEHPIYTKYKGLTENFLLSIVDDPNDIKKDNDGKIRYVFLYNDSTNPTNQSGKIKDSWKSYFLKLEKLSQLSI